MARSNKKTGKLPPTSQPKYLTTREAAKLLGLAEQTIHNWRFLSRNLPYKRRGRMIRYLESDIVEFMESGTVLPKNVEGI